VAVRRALADVAAASTADRDGPRVLVACSGGADSVALAAATAVEAHALGVPAGLVTVDHGLQPGSAQRAAAVAELGRRLRLEPVRVLPVEVGTAGGPEAAARAARYTALREAATAAGAAYVLLGHTLDDQAETVLLGLGRGSGPRSVAGMRPVDPPWLRPLLETRRASTAAACAAEGLAVWADPHNCDPRFTRARLRHEALPLLEEVLQGGVAGALARTAALLRADLDALDAAADRVGAELTGHLPGEDPRRDMAGSTLDAVRLAEHPAAVRTRVLRAWLAAAGTGPLTSAHLQALDSVVTAWRGQGPVALPGGLAVSRRRGRLHLDRPQGSSQRTRPRPGRQQPEQQQPGQQPPGMGRLTSMTSRAEQNHAPMYAGEIDEILVTREQIRDRIGELAERISADYADRELLLVGVLKGAVMVMSDLARALSRPVTLEFMAVSSYGSSASSSGIVRILKDLDRDISGRHVLVVEDIVDSGLTLSWLLKNLATRHPASLEVMAMLRKPDATKVHVPVRYVGFDIPNEFVVGYGLDYAERYRDLPYVARLKPEVYTR